ncbi:4Fe-4S binding protein [bacterium]|nr:4Fe-4S binding protein [bacterium]
MGKLIIDGIEVEPDPSKTILQVANELGIHIPTLCYHPSLPYYGACRVCIVETIWRGRSTLSTACTFPAWEGEVKTDSEMVRKARKVILELMLAEAPDSPEIMELAREYGIEETRFKVRKERIGNKCIQCALCVRFCRDVLGIGAIGFKNRGYTRELTTPFEIYSDVCTTCGACEFLCPTNAIDLSTISPNKPIPLLSEYEAGLKQRSCINIPFPQAIPNKPVLDRDHCMHFLKDACGVCSTVCGPQAINYDQEEEIVEEDVGAIVVATGYDLYPIINIPEYGGGKYKDVLDGLQFERLLSASGPTAGEVKRPSDGKVPKRVVFISCVGSRDPENHFPYCSKICCMYSAKHAMLYKHKVHDGEAVVFYIDIRSDGKGYEEFVTRAQEEDNVLYIRGKVSKIYKNEKDNLVVMGADTLSGNQIEIECELVVLSMAVRPKEGTNDLVNKLKIQADANGFLTEAHPKLRPVETLTGGFFLAGAAQAPKDIPDTVAQASGAAAKVVSMFSEAEIHKEPVIAAVDAELCSGCQMCIPLCPYDAREFDEKNKIAVVNEGLCEGCGCCISACPSGACQQRNLNDTQILSMIKVALEK